MDTPTESLIDDLAARTTIDDCGDFSLVTIPHFSTLSESERTVVLHKAQYRPRNIKMNPKSRANVALRQLHANTSLDADDLASRLLCITPPPLDEEEENEETRQLEAEARKELEDDGCPACYPPDLDIPLQNLHSELQAIVTYWQCRSRDRDTVLRSQVADWRRFRLGQLWARAYFRNKPYSRFVGEVCERRRKYNLGGDVRLLMDPKQQSRLENWMEYQDYHLIRFEELEKEQVKSKQRLNSARSDTNTAGSEHTAQNIANLECFLYLCGQDLEQEKVLLHWIEQQRQAMTVEYPTPPPQEDRDNQVTRSSAGDDRMEPTPRSTTEEGRSLRQLRPRRVPKAKCVGDVSSKPLTGTQNRGVGQTQPPNRARSKRWLAAQRLRPALKNSMTRSGRISKPPLRWAP